MNLDSVKAITIPEGVVTKIQRGNTVLWASCNHEYSSVITEPTCTDRGYTTHTCACGDSYVDNYVAALGHDWGETPADGSPRVCNRCGAKDIKGMLTVRVTFEDNVVPAGLDTFKITITPPNGFKQTFRARIDDPEVRLIELPLGSYTVEELTDKIQAEGYNLYTRYIVQYDGGEPFEGQTLTLTEENTRGTVTIINSYVAI